LRGGRKSKRPLKLYLKALVLKEIGKMSLRYAESYALICIHETIPKSTLNYWEINCGFLLKSLLEELFKVIRFIRYDYTVLDSTKFTDLHKALHEAFICVRVRLGEALIPVQIGLPSSEAEFIKILAQALPLQMEHSMQSMC
jgi:hypothetical protein